MKPNADNSPDLSARSPRREAVRGAVCRAPGSVLRYVLRRTDGPMTPPTWWRRRSSSSGAGSMTRPVDDAHLWLYGVARRVSPTIAAASVVASRLADQLRSDLAEAGPAAGEEEFAELAAAFDRCPTVSGKSSPWRPGSSSTRAKSPRCSVARAMPRGSGCTERAAGCERRCRAGGAGRRPAVHRAQRRPPPLAVERPRERIPSPVARPFARPTDRKDMIVTRGDNS